MYKRHKKPLVIGVGIVGLALLVSTSTYIASSFIKNDPVDPIKPKEKDLEELLKKYEKIKKEGKDPLNVFSVYELASITTYKFSKREYYFTIGKGKTVNLNEVIVTNCLIKRKNEAFEESISYSDGIAGLFANSKRDYLGDDVISYDGKSYNDKYKADWNKSSKVSASKDDFYNKTGKLPNDPFAYDITKDTVLDDSKCEKDGNGYKISLVLDKEKSITRYSKRVSYMSKEKVFPYNFSNIHFTLFTDNDFNIHKSKVNESYLVLTGISNEGSMETTYYTDDTPEIPNIDSNFDYSRYN